MQPKTQPSYHTSRRGALALRQTRAVMHSSGVTPGNGRLTKHTLMSVIPTRDAGTKQAAPHDEGNTTCTDATQHHNKSGTQATQAQNNELHTTSATQATCTDATQHCDITGGTDRRSSASLTHMLVGGRDGWCHTGVVRGVLEAQRVEGTVVPHHTKHIRFMQYNTHDCRHDMPSL